MGASESLRRLPQVGKIENNLHQLTGKKLAMLIDVKVAYARHRIWRTLPGVAQLALGRYDN